MIALALLTRFTHAEINNENHRITEIDEKGVNICLNQKYVKIENFAYIILISLIILWYISSKNSYILIISSIFLLIIFYLDYKL